MKNSLAYVALFIVAVIVVHIHMVEVLRAQDNKPMIIRYLPSIGDDVYSSNQYYYKVLKLALDETISTHGPYELVPGTSAKTVLDAIKVMLQDEGIDIVHTNTDKSRERVLLPVRIPLDKGLIGARLVMAYKTKNKFKQVKSVTDLRKYTYGQGHFWPDTEILKFNNLQVSTTKEYSELFSQLADGSIDGFPRAVFEIWDEVESQTDKNFVVAEHFYLYYPAAIYFFVRKDAAGAKIAKRVDEGLRIAIKKGSFDKLFNETMKPFLDKAKLEERIVIKLKNPLLSDETPLEDSVLWYISNE